MRFHIINKHAVIATEKATQIFDSFSEEKQLLVLEKVKEFSKATKPSYLLSIQRKIHIDDILPCLPLFLEKEQALEFLLLEAQDFFQKEFHTIDWTFNYHADDVVFYLAQYVKQLERSLTNTIIVEDWFMPDIFTKEEWEQTVEVERAVRMNWIKAHYEYYQNDKNLLDNIRSKYLLHISEFTYILNMHFFETNIKFDYNEDETKISEKKMRDAKADLHYILAKYNDFFKDKIYYNSFLKSYILEQQIELEKFIRRNNENFEIINKDLHNILENYNRTNKIRQSTKMQFELFFQTGRLFVKLSSSQYIFQSVLVTGLGAVITTSIFWNVTNSYVGSIIAFILSILFAYLCIESMDN